MSTTEDLFYYANILNKISRTKEATEYIDELITTKPALIQQEYELFGFVYKSAIEPIRSTLRSLIVFHSEVDGLFPLRAELIQVEKEKSYGEFSTICHHVIDLITLTLLPNAVDEKAQIFYYKTLGDYYRYLAEFESSEEDKKVMDEAGKAYNKALNLSNNLLPACNPLKLGVTLNYAIFKYDHLKEMEEAKNILEEAKNEAEPELGQLSQDSRNEALEILSAMNTNLVVWNDEDENEKEQI